jgi:hypothetical protein
MNKANKANKGGEGTEFTRRVHENTHSLEEKISASKNRIFFNIVDSRIGVVDAKVAILAWFLNSGNTCPPPALRRRFMKG